MFSGEQHVPAPFRLAAKSCDCLIYGPIKCPKSGEDVKMLDCNII
jgi:hypothetical protein